MKRKDKKMIIGVGLGVLALWWWMNKNKAATAPTPAAVTQAPVRPSPTTMPDTANTTGSALSGYPYNVTV